jgi:hypothetical protein
MADEDDRALAAERLELERRKHADDVRLAERRLAQEAAQTGRLSTGAVAVIGALIALVSAAVTGAIAGLFGVQTEQVITDREFTLEERRVDAELERLRREQQFQVLLRATEDVPEEVAAKNLEFFVDIGYLEDPTGQIKAYARRGEAPQIASTGGNPLAALRAAARATGVLPSAEEGFVVVDDVLVGPQADAVEDVPTENYSPLESRSYAVVHATIGPADSAVAAMQQGRVEASVHVVITRDGTIKQLLPFRLAAWHVGGSAWGSTRLQRHSIGISLENLGQLKEVDGGWQDWVGRPVPETEVVTLPGQGSWQAFTPEQVTATVKILRALRTAYPEIRDVVAHEEIEPERRRDPGPAFPLAAVRLETFGREGFVAPD